MARRTGGSGPDHGAPASCHRSARSAAAGVLHSRPRRSKCTRCA